MKQHTFTFFFALVCVCLLHEIRAAEWKSVEVVDCGSKGAVVSAVRMSPPKPRRGDTLVIETTFTSDSTVTKGTLRTKVTRRVFGRPFSITGTTDMCGVLKSGKGCPIQAGETVVLVNTTPLTIFTPYGDYYFEIRSYDQDDELMTCIQTVLHFHPYVRTNLANT